MQKHSTVTHPTRLLAGWPPHTSVEEGLEVIRTVFNNPTTWAIALKDELGHPIGAIGYGSSCDCGLPDALPDEPCVGYWIAESYWGKGYCTEALGRRPVSPRSSAATSPTIPHPDG
jgi:acetyltransferase, GNAT family